MPLQTKSELMAGLRAQIAALETPLSRAGRPHFRLGLSEVDALLPDGGLLRGGVHEVAAASYGDMAAAVGFAAALAVRACEDCHLRPVVWCQQGWGAYDMGQLYAPGLAGFGLDPSRLLLVNPSREPDMLWALEECLRSGVLAAIVGEVPSCSRHFNLRASRRLQLAAEDASTPLILLRGHEEGLSASAAQTRWRVTSRSARDQGQLLAASQPCWDVMLEKCKGGPSFSRLLVWNGVSGCFEIAQDRMPSKVQENVRKLSPPVLTAAARVLSETA
ncbi:MAG: hypothetical protein JJ939_03570 [Alphaproteobacteria bacterium]|nr:hypothetical protein [Rhodobiaceae bacterium]MBO6543446.1 hypothetical protein [Alphaproteobacteria bacterium]MBO6627481.1 hypothetical protein [Alphaproteobacteria bacterium]MDF1627120.1 hypothetical protein [Parvibaculaceae bacterium]